MLLLTHALESIRLWLENNYAEGAAQLLPGLSLTQIEEFSQDLPFDLPQEAYKLYQWSRGNDAQSHYGTFFDPRDGMGLCSLQRAAELSFTLRDDEYEECDIKHLGQPLFPIFEFEGSFLSVVSTPEPQVSSPIIFISETTEVTVRYISLTSMMQTIAECFEMGVVSRKSTYYDPNVKILQYDQERFTPIYRKHNSNLPELSVSAFCREIKRRDLSPVRLEKTLNSLNNQIAFLKLFWKDLSLEQMSTEAREILTAAAQDENEVVRGYVKSALKMLLVGWQPIAD